MDWLYGSSLTHFVEPTLSRHYTTSKTTRTSHADSMFPTQLKLIYII